jgi:hypothetical protein
VTVRIVAGEIHAKDVTTRTTIPSSGLPQWPPFERVAETIANPRRRAPAHRHEAVEVLTYVIEGAGSYQFGSDPPQPFGVGSAAVLYSTEPVSHAINPEKGRTLRWFAVIASLPAGRAFPARSQVGRVEASPPQADGTVVRRWVGPGASFSSAAGIEAEVIEFHSTGATFRRVGHDRLAIGYTLSGRGAVDGSALEVGEAALIDEAAGIGIQGSAGFRVALVSAPRPA